MTKFIDNTKEKGKKEIKKKTVFKKYIHIKGNVSDDPSQPEDYDCVELIRRRDDDYKFDLFAAYDKGYKGKVEHWYLGDAGDEFE